MALGIEKLEVVLGHAIELINAEQKLQGFEWAGIEQEVFDLEEAEALRLAEKLKVLDLNNDALEAAIEGGASKAAQPLAFALRVLKMFLPKK